MVFYDFGYIQPNGTGDYWIDTALGQSFEGGGASTWYQLQYPFIKYLGPYSYASNSVLTEVEIPEGVTHVEEGAFSGCANLASVSFPSTLEEIGEFAFADCAALSSVTLPEGFGNYAASAFRGCPRNMGLDAQGGAGGTAAVGGFVGAPLPKIVPPALTGHSFCGYWTAAGGKGVQYYDGGGNALRPCPLPPGSTLYAAWTPNTYSVAYDLNGGTSPSGGLSTATYGLPFPVSAPVREGYVFFGWRVSSGLDANTGKWGETYLQWNGIPGPAAVCGNVGGERTWFLNLTPAPNGSVRLTAVWKRNTYDISYDLNGGEVFSGSIPTATLGVPFPVPAPVRSGYSFSGWAVSSGLATGTARWGVTYTSWTPIPNSETRCANGPDGKVWFLDISGPEGSATLMATWKKENTYDVLYDLNGGGLVVGSISNATYGLPFPVHAPTRRGHAFAGWRVSSGLNAGTAKWGETYTEWTPIADADTLCANGTEGTVWFLNISEPYGVATIRAEWIANVTVGTPAAVPHEFLEDRAPSLLAECGGDYEAAANAPAANGVNKVWECYVAGIDPTDEEARFEATIEIGADGKPEVKWNPPLSEEEAAKRTYRTYGKKTLDPKEGWTDVTDVEDLDAAGWKFFKAAVEMK